jgi:hypothetical protein
MARKTLRELAQELGLEANLNPNGAIGADILEIEPQFGIVEREGKIKLIDLASLARFNPMTIGRQASITRQGFNALIAQLGLYKRQRGLAR